MQLHEKLVILRKENQLTQQKVAEELNVSRQAISRWESGVSLPSTDNLKGLSTLYHVPVDYLLHDSTERTAPIEKTVNPTSKANNNKLKKHRIITVCILIFICLLAVTVYITKHKTPDELNFTDISNEQWTDEDEDKENFTVTWK